MTIRTYALFGASDLQVVQAKVMQSVNSWANKWLAEDTLATVPQHTQNAFTAEAAGLLPDDGQALEVSYAAAPALARVLLSAPCVPSLCQAALSDVFMSKSASTPLPAAYLGLVRAMLQDLLGMIAAPSQLPSGRPMQAMTPASEDWSNSTQKGLGTVVIILGIPSAAWTLWLAEPLARSILGPVRKPVGATPLCARRAAIGHGLLQVQVSAGEAELPLADIFNLAPGDVVKLNARFEQPLMIRVKNGGVPICAAHLGTSADCKAVQLVA